MCVGSRDRATQLLRWCKNVRTKVERHSSWGAGRRWRERGTAALATLTALSLHDHFRWTPLTYLHLRLDFAKGCVFVLAKAVTAFVVASPARANAAASAAAAAAR